MKILKIVNLSELVVYLPMTKIMVKSFISTIKIPYIISNKYLVLMMKKLNAIKGIGYYEYYFTSNTRSDTITWSKGIGCIFV